MVGAVICRSEVMKENVKKIVLAAVAGACLLTGCAGQVAVVNRAEWEQQKQEIAALKAGIGGLQTSVEKLHDEEMKQLKLINADLRVLFSDLSRNLNVVSGKLEENQYNLEKLSKTTTQLTERKFVVRSVAGRDSLLQDTVVAEDKVDVQKLFKIAREDFNAKDYERARKEFEELNAKFPDDNLADDCRYWAAECYYVQKKYKEALEQYREVVEKYPTGDMGPAAMFKMGLCYKGLSDKKNMEKTWTDLISKYPNSDEAMQAKARTGN